jgi:DNA polymerase IIIc chi subunit
MFKIHVPALAGAYFIVASTVTWAQSEQLAQGLSDFEAASSEIVALLQTIEDAETAAATAPQILAATERQDEAEAAIQTAIQGMDPENPDHGAQIEQVFQKVQSANQAVADAQMHALERQTASQDTQ